MRSKESGRRYYALSIYSRIVEGGVTVVFQDFFRLGFLLVDGPIKCTYDPETAMIRTNVEREKGRLVDHR